MNKDKAIKQALQRRDDKELPYSLKNSILVNICNEAEKRAKRNYIYSIIIVSCVSAILIKGTIYLLIAYFGFSFSFPEISLSQDAKRIFMSCSFIASIILLLLIFDTVLRNRYNKYKNRL